MAKTNGTPKKHYPTPPDVVTVNIKPSQNADPAEWPDSRYEELIGYADMQHTEAMKMLALFKSEQEIVNARHKATQDAMKHAIQQEDQDRLSAKWLANYPRVVELPGIIDYWQNRLHKLHMQKTRANQEIWGRQNRIKAQERSEEERLEREKGEAEEAELRKSIIQAKWTPKQKREYEARQREKATRDERIAAELAKQAAKAQRQEQVKQDADNWTQIDD